MFQQIRGCRELYRGLEPSAFILARCLLQSTPPLANPWPKAHLRYAMLLHVFRVQGTAGGARKMQPWNASGVIRAAGWPPPYHACPQHSI